MKKLTFLLLVCTLMAGTAAAQNEDARKAPVKRKEIARFRPKFHNFSSVYQLLKPDAGVTFIAPTRRSTGGAYTTGRSFIVHPGAIGGILRFGVDAVWTDVNYSFHSPVDKSLEQKIHQLEVGVGVGPAIHVNPVSKLGIHTYFRYNPSCSGMFQKINNDETRGAIGYGSFFTTGGAVSWGIISIGAEARWGSGNYKILKDKDDAAPSKAKIKTSGMRAYVSLRF